MAFDIVVVGHVAVDHNRFPWGTIENVLGGAPTYAGLAAVALHKTTGIVSKIGRDFLERFPPIFSKLGLDTEGMLVVGERTTTFENTYDEHGHRTQLCKHVTPEITPQDIPASYLDARAFYVSPIAGEISPELLRHLKAQGGIVMLDPQGVLREIGEKGRVEVKSKDLSEYLKHVDIVKIGMEEAVILGKDAPEAMRRLRNAGPKVVIVTRGKDPVSVLCNDEVRDYSTLRVSPQDVTGAGDIFGAAFLCKYLSSGNALESTRFAIVAAGLKIRYRGPVGFPSEEEVLETLREIQ
jgi:sugar/nucleoside kinase (ribokinase family)